MKLSIRRLILSRYNGKPKKLLLSPALSSIRWRDLFSARGPRLRSADFQSAVSRISNPPALETSGVSEWSGGLPNGIRRYSRLEICATLNTYRWERENRSPLSWNVVGRR